MNKRNLIRIGVVGLVLASAATVLADGAQGPGPRGGDRGPGAQGGMARGQAPALPDSTRIVQMVAELATSLDLSADQKEQVADLYFAHFADVRAEMTGASGDRPEHRKKMAAKRQQFENDVKALLNDDQKAEFDKLAEKRRPPQGR